MLRAYPDDQIALVILMKTELKKGDVNLERVFKEYNINMECLMVAKRLRYGLITEGERWYDWVL